MVIELTPAQCENILAGNHYAHLGCLDGDEPHVVPITYAYENGCFYGFTFEGAKIMVLRNNPKMCVQVENIVSEHEWESVMCWGLFEEITENEETQRIKLAFAERHGDAILGHEDPPVTPGVHESHPRSKKKPVVYRMRPYRVTGRAERP